MNLTLSWALSIDHFFIKALHDHSMGHYRRAAEESYSYLSCLRASVTNLLALGHVSFLSFLLSYSYNEISFRSLSLEWNMHASVFMES